LISERAMVSRRFIPPDRSSILAPAFSLADPRPVLIVTDYAMHTMNGMDLINACRQVDPQQRILLVSGTVDESIYRNAAEKPDEFLAKPYQSRQLASLVRSLVAS
jgi:CheY-like chemotaxis protein